MKRRCSVATMADYMKAFAHPLRLRIIYSLNHHEKSVTELVNELEERQCNISLQLLYLNKKNIVQRRAEKRFAFYSLTERHSVHLLELVRVDLQHDQQPTRCF